MKPKWHYLFSILVLLSPVAASAQANKSVFVVLQSKQDSAADQKIGSGAASILKDLLESAHFKELKAKFPCIHYLDSSAVAIMLDVERQRALLGSDEDSRRAEIVAAQGARYLVTVSVNGVGDKVYINGAVLDDLTGAELSNGNLVSNWGEAAVKPIEQLARNLVGSMRRGPQCPGYWRGTVTVQITRNWQDDRRGTSETGNATQICQVLGAGEDARCSYDSTDTLQGKDGSLMTKKRRTTRQPESLSRSTATC